MSMIRVENLTFSYPSSYDPIFENEEYVIVPAKTRVGSDEQSLKNEVLPLIFHAGLALVRQYKESGDQETGVLCKDALLVCRQCLTFTEKRTQSEDWKKVSCG